MAPILSGRRAGLVLALAALLAPLGVGTAQAATPPPVVVTSSPTGAVFSPIPVQFSCADPDAIALDWRTSQAQTGTVMMPDETVNGTVYYTAYPSYNSQGGHWIEAFCVDADGRSATDGDGRSATDGDGAAPDADPAHSAAGLADAREAAAGDRGAGSGTDDAAVTADAADVVVADSREGAEEAEKEPGSHAGKETNTR